MMGEWMTFMKVTLRKAVLVLGGCQVHYASYDGYNY